MRLPERGLRYLLRAWTGEGELARCVAAVQPDATDGHGWSAADVRRRAHRIMFERLEGSVARWPDRAATWYDALPVTSSAMRFRAPFPFAGVDWVETWRRSGFPPSEFYGRVRKRDEDSVLLATLRWTVERLLLVAADARMTWDKATVKVDRQLHVAGQLLGSAPLASAVGLPPGNVELLAVRREGVPWGAVADVAAALRLLDNDATTLAFELLAPDPQVRWRLFHLGVLGDCLFALQSLGCTVSSLRPISGGSPGPAFKAVAPDGSQWDVWFEAGGAWRYPAYARTEPYRSAALGARAAYQPLGADVMVVSPGRKALVIECKFGGADYVCRNGYLQAVTYAVEAREFAPEVAGLVVGPEGVVGCGFAETSVGRITIAPPSGLRDVLLDLIS